MITLAEKTGFDAGSVVFTILIALVLAGLSTLLVLSIIKEIKRVRNEKSTKKVNLGLMTRRAADQALNDFIRVYRLSNEASCFLFELTNVNELIDSFGRKNESIIKEKMMQNVVNILPKNTLLAEYSPDTDSYMVIIRGNISRDRLLAFAEDLVSAIETPISVPGTDVETSYSCYMGISFYPSQAITSSDLINKANVALYMNHKESNKNYSIYNTQFDETEKENINYYNEVRNAIKNKEFTLYYQPIVNYEKDEIEGFEALIRWEHPTLGLLPPKKFLTVLENSGDIVWVGKWSIQTICAFYSENISLFRNKDVFFSINLSLKQLLNPSVVADFQEICKKYNVPTSAICVEIEEYALYEKYQTISETLKDFQKKGFKVAVDQFGLDSNNMVKLAKQDLYMVKISTRDLLDNKESFVGVKVNEMLLETCKNKNINLCALMVEDKDTIDYLTSIGISLQQGYYFASPMNANAAIEFATKNEWKK